MTRLEQKGNIRRKMIWKGGKNDEINDIKLFEKKLEKSVGSFVKIATHQGINSLGINGRRKSKF